MSSDLITSVSSLYSWLDAQLAANPDPAGQCTRCGRCCHFDDYGHRLYITSVELEYFKKALAPAPLKPMTTGRCPYQDRNLCTVHPHRFAACRIFTCTGNPDFQSALTEQALARLKSLCTRFKIPYRYQDLASALAPRPTAHPPV
jgi:Fe-S-cluster containining protein